jgi:hypothetical protein
MGLRTLLPGYCIDTSALVDLWRTHYPPDVFRTLWTKDLENLISQGILIAPEEVLNELEKRDDELLEWAKNHRKMFKDLNREQQQQLRIILGKFQDFVDTKKNIDADPIVVALAKSKDWTVITSESTKKGGRPRIPYVCKDFDVKCITLVEFFREQGWEY